MPESTFQKQIIDRVEFIFPDSIVIKNDCNYIQGIPDLSILFRDRWACLECKRSSKEPYRPNQEYYLALLNEMSFAAMICPDNEEDILHELQRSFSSVRRTRIPKR